MTSFADALAAEQDAAKGYLNRGCKVRQALDALTDQDRATATTALDNPTVEGAVIARAFAALGQKVPAYTVQRHRRGECRCPR